VKARGGYAELIALGAASLWLALDVASGPGARAWRWILLGGVSGVGLWTDPLYIVYLCPVVLYVALQQRARLPLVKALGALVAFAIGAGPMFLANLRSHGETLRELAGPNVSQPTTVAVFHANLVETLRESLPILVGFFEASSNAGAFSAARAAADWPTWILTPIQDGLAVAGLALLIVSAWHAARLGPTPLDLLTWVGACTVGLFCLSQVESLYLTEPRYLLPLYSLIPVAGLVVSTARSLHPVGAAALLACVVALNVLSIARFDPALTAPWLDGQLVDAGNPSLVRFLEDRSITTFYADYWLAYPVAFQSREQVVPSVIDDHLRVGFNRYIPYAIAVDGSSDPAIVVVANSHAEKKLREMLLTSGRTYRFGRWRNLDVYDHLSPAFRPIRG